MNTKTWKLRNKYINLKNKGGNLEEFLEIKNKTQGTISPISMGRHYKLCFSSGKPWLKVTRTLKL
jgi:hypothetical protein